LFFRENEEFEIRNGVIVMNLNGISATIVRDTNIKAISNIEYKYFK